MTKDEVTNWLYDNLNENMREGAKKLSFRMFGVVINHNLEKWQEDNSLPVCGNELAIVFACLLTLYTVVGTHREASSDSRAEDIMMLLREVFSLIDKYPKKV